MKCKWMLAAIALLPLAAMAQNAVPLGTIIPAQLEKGINVSKLPVGRQIKAKVTQDVPGTQVRKGDEVLGQIEKVSSTTQGQARIVLRFDAVQVQGKRIPLITDLRALASPPEIEDAQTPLYGPDSGIPFEQSTTRQIGGEEDYRGGGPVMDGAMKVGESAYYGILAQPRVVLGMRCRGALDGNSNPQALWLFSTDACGVYGFGDLRIEHAGRTAPVGSIVLSSQNSKLNINGGSGLLLRVQGS